MDSVLGYCTICYNNSHDETNHQCHSCNSFGHETSKECICEISKKIIRLQRDIQYITKIHNIEIECLTKRIESLEECLGKMTK